VTNSYEHRKKIFFFY